MRNVPDIAAAELSRLRANGIEPTDDEIVWLASLGRRVECPSSMTAEAAGFTGAVRMSDGTVLRPLTLRADAWLAEYGYALRGGLDKLAVGYAAENAGALVFDVPARQVVQAVRRWGRSLRVSANEFCRAIERIIGTDDAPEKPKREDEEPFNRDELIGTLVSGTGLPREYWENESWIAVGHAHAGLMKYAAMISVGEYDPDKAAGRKALADFSRAIKQIRERHA